VAISVPACLPRSAVGARREVSLLGQTVDWQFGPRQLVAVGAILFLSVVNGFSVALGGKVQSALTVLKIGGIAFVVLGIFFFSGSAGWSHLQAPPGGRGGGGWGGLGNAVLGRARGLRGWGDNALARGGGGDPGAA